MLAVKRIKPLINCNFGFGELIMDQKKNEMEIAYLGILEEYFGKKLGGFLLSELIKKSFLLNVKRVWVHTCSLDHKYALKNYFLSL